MATERHPKIIPTKAATVKPSFERDASKSESSLWALREDTEWLRLLREFPGGGELYGGSGGVGPLSKEFPS